MSEAKPNRKKSELAQSIDEQMSGALSQKEDEIKDYGIKDIMLGTMRFSGALKKDLEEEFRKMGLDFPAGMRFALIEWLRNKKAR